MRIFYTTGHNFTRFEYSGADGWDFLKEFQKLYIKFTKAIDVYILSSFLTDADQCRSMDYPFVKVFYLKPMASLLLKQLRQNYGHVA